MIVERIPATSEGMPERFRLKDVGMECEVVPSAGFGLVSWRFDGEELLSMPLPLEEFMKEAHTAGIPLLYPWANRLRGDHYSVHGKDVDLSNVQGLKRDANGFPMHGLLLRFASWNLEMLDDGVAGTIDWAEHPELMAAFPFPHQLRVSWVMVEGGVCATLEVAASTCDVPLAGGWHPYFAPTVADQRDLTLEGPLMQPIPLDANGLPSGPPGEAIDESGPLGDRTFDTLYTAPLKGFAFSVTGDSLKVEVCAGNEWKAMQLYATSTGGFVCVEPMLAPTAALSDGTAGRVKAGETMRASFTVTARGRS